MPWDRAAQGTSVRVRRRRGSENRRNPSDSDLWVIFYLSEPHYGDYRGGEVRLHALPMKRFPQEKYRGALSQRLSGAAEIFRVQEVVPLLKEPA